MPYKKALSIMLALLLVLSAAPAALADAASFLGQDMRDFSVTTLDGSVFTLSEALKEKELVFINLWASWCQPCRMEFPFMQKAYQEYKDRVALIAISVERSDTMDVIAAFAQENGVTGLPFARDENDLLNTLQIKYFPTSFAVDRFGKVVYVGFGALLDPTLFTNLFDEFLGDGYTETKVREEEIDVAENHYAVFFYDSETGKGVEGCSVSFCTDMDCVTAVSDETGLASFTIPPQVYHVKIVSLPDGYQAPEGDEEGYSEAAGTLYCIPLSKTK